jgi:hypothetical protein
VDPLIEPNTPAGKSLEYAVGTARISGAVALSDTTSHTYNAELIKQLSPAMQAKIARYGALLGQRVSIAHNGTGVVIAFTGQLQSADTLLGPWVEVQGATSPFAVSGANGSKFYRAAE